jgi:hypothetical protein
MLADRIADRTTPPGVFYLLPPRKAPEGFELPPDNVLFNFYFWFGGLRLEPPFMSSDFSRSRCLLPDEYNEEAIKNSGPEWSNAEWVYTCLNGDILVINSMNKLGWFLHESNEITPLKFSFPEILHYIIRTGVWHTDAS